MSKAGRRAFAAVGSVFVLVVSAGAWLALEIDAVGVTGERRPPHDPAGSQGLLIVVALAMIGVLWLWATPRSPNAD